MAVKTQAQLLAEVASLLADNTTGNISALDVRTCLNDIIDSANYGGSKVYKALLTQSGTSAPVATVLVNTLSGTPVWSYDYVGGYVLTLASEFQTGKTLMYISTKNTGTQSCIIAEGDGLNTILVDTVDSTGTGINGVLSSTSITIEVYP